MKWAGSSFDSSSVIRHFLGWVCLARLSRVWCPLRGLFGCGVSGASFLGATTASPLLVSRLSWVRPVLVSHPSLAVSPRALPPRPRLLFCSDCPFADSPSAHRPPRGRPVLVSCPFADSPSAPLVLFGVIEAMILANGHMRWRNMPLRCVRPVTHGATMMMRRRLSWGGLTPLSTTDGYRRRCRR